MNWYQNQEQQAQVTLSMQEIQRLMAQQREIMMHTFVQIHLEKQRQIQSYDIYLVEKVFEMYHLHQQIGITYFTKRWSLQTEQRTLE
jgi:uncharacterized 2Fe-2S/4Fe-4S cluster protein (DUF4445 family)